MIYEIIHKPTQEKYIGFSKYEDIKDISNELFNLAFEEPLKNKMHKILCTKGEIHNICLVKINADPLTTPQMETFVERKMQKEEYVLNGPIDERKSDPGDDIYCYDFTKGRCVI